MLSTSCSKIVYQIAGRCTAAEPTYNFLDVTISGHIHLYPFTIRQGEPIVRSFALRLYGHFVP